MNGVTIILENRYHGVSLPLLITLFVLSVAAMVWLVYVLKQTHHPKFDPPFWKSANMIVIAIAIGFLSIAAYMTIKEYRTIYTEYTVQVENSASLNEFLDKYEIVSRDGNTYVVKERETNG